MKTLKQLPKGARIVVNIGADGSIHSRVQGIDGPSCEGFLDNLADLFETLEHSHTDDFYAEVDEVTAVGS